MNDKSFTPTLALVHKYPKNCRLIAHDGWEPHPDARIIAHLTDGMYKVETMRGSVFDASQWYLETYYAIELPDGICLN